MAVWCRTLPRALQSRGWPTCFDTGINTMPVAAHLIVDTLTCFITRCLRPGPIMAQAIMAPPPSWPHPHHGPTRHTACCIGVAEPWTGRCYWRRLQLIAGVDMFMCIDICKDMCIDLCIGMRIGLNITMRIHHSFGRAASLTLSADATSTKY